jgi:hypothetical protein
MPPIIASNETLVDQLPVLKPTNNVQLILTNIPNIVNATLINAQTI